MKLSTILSSYFTIFCTLSAVQSQGQCGEIQIRKEIRELSKDELQKFIKAFKQFMNASGQCGLAYFSKVHLDAHEAAHGTPAFLPWHRKFLREVEKCIQKIDSSVTMPYWDWTKDSQAPEKSVVFTSEYFGGNGSGNQMCLQSGPFANIRVKVPSDHCLKRSFDRGTRISAFYPAPQLELDIDGSNDYQRIWKNLEGSLHASVHMNVGSNKADVGTMYSPNDPVFFLHHGFIDCLWYEWQLRKGTVGKTYGGPNARVTDSIRPWSTKVSEMIDPMTSKDLCYKYSQRFSGKLPSSRKGIQSIKRLPKTRAKVSTTITTNLSFSMKNWSFTKIEARNVHEVAMGLLNGTFESKPVDPVDRIEKNKLRTPKPVPEDFILMNGIDVNEFRAQEEVMAAHIDAINLLNDLDDDDKILNINDVTNDIPKVLPTSDDLSSLLGGI